MARTNFRVTFRTKVVRKVATRAVAKALDRVQGEMAKAIKKEINKGWPPPSRPGQPPHRRTGNLWRSITTKRKGGSVTIVAAPYAKHLEFGTQNMRARPFISKVIHDRAAFWSKRIAQLAKAAVPDKRATRGFRIPRGAVKGLG